MTTANPPALTAQVLFFSRLQHPLQPRPHTGRISTWPFKVVRDRDDIRIHAARVIRTTAESWWPPES